MVEAFLVLPDDLDLPNFDSRGQSGGNNFGVDFATGCAKDLIMFENTPKGEKIVGVGIEFDSGKLLGFGGHDPTVADSQSVLPETWYNKQMENWKTIAGVFGASLVLVVVMAVGLSKLSGDGGGTLKVPVEQLTEGARWEVMTGEPRVTVVAFTDIQCPACKAAEPMAKELRSTPGVRFVHRHFPLTTLHKNAWKGGRALEAARLVGGGWEMMALMFDKQAEWSDLSDPDGQFIAYAKVLGLAEGEFAEKYRSRETDEWVGVDSSLGNRLKLAGTPTFFVNGEQVATSFVLDKVKELLK